MAWRSSGTTNASLIENLSANGLIKSARVKGAMLAVDRAHFVPGGAGGGAYQDSPQGIGHGATISAPHMHASACESLLEYLHPTARVLDVGSGSGYLTAVLAQLVGPAGRVVGVEHIAALVAQAEANMRKSDDGRAILLNGRVRFVCADGRLGWPYGARGAGAVAEGTELDDGYDAIHVGAAAVEAHDELVGQLRRPGRMFIPISSPASPSSAASLFGMSDAEQHIYVINKAADGSLQKRKMYGVRYVPLTDAPPA